MSPAEIIAALELVKELEPEGQKIVVGLIHLLHHKKKQAPPPAPAVTRIPHP